MAWAETGKLRTSWYESEFLLGNFPRNCRGILVQISRSRPIQPTLLKGNEAPPDIHSDVPVKPTGGGTCGKARTFPPSCKRMSTSEEDGS